MSKLKSKVLENVSQSSSVDLEIVKLEAKLAKSPDNLDLLLQLAELYMQLGRRSKISLYVVASVRCFLTTPGTVEKGLITVATAMRFWRAERYSNKEQLRLNITAERSDVLMNCERILVLLDAMNDAEHTHRISLQLANTKALRGEVADALAIYSELITVQAMDCGVEYTYIIFQAAILLKHIGQNAQAIEYLEFLIDDPPVSDGYSKMHMLAFLVLVYEQSGSHYSIVKERTYEELLGAYQSELSKGNRPVTNLKKIENMLSRKSIGESSEIWEMLGLQAIERCDYILAIELMRQAVLKVTTKSRLFFLLAELYFITNNFDQSLLMAEKAFALNPQSAELRNLLLMLAPEKWTEKIRSLSAIPQAHAGRGHEEKARAGAVTRLNDHPGSPESGDESRGRKGGGNWLSQVKSRAENAMKQMQEEFVPKVENMLRHRSASPPKRHVEKPTGDLYTGADGQKKSNGRQPGVSKDARVASPPVGVRSKSGRMKRTLTKEEAERAKEREGLPARPTMPVLDCSESRILLSRILSGDTGNTHLYDKDLQALVNIRKATNEAEEAATKARMKANATVPVGKSVVNSAVPSTVNSKAPSRAGSARGIS